MSRKLKRIQTVRLCCLCASASLLAAAWIWRSKGLILVWMCYCLAVQLAVDMAKGRIYRGLFQEEQKGFAAFMETWRGAHEGWNPNRLGFAYKSGAGDCAPVLCYFGDDGIRELGRLLEKYFVAYIGGRMIYAFRFSADAELGKTEEGQQPRTAVNGGGQTSAPGLQTASSRPWQAWEELPQRHQQYLCEEAKKYGRYLIVENFIYEAAFSNMKAGRRNQPCDTVRMLSRMKKEPMYGAQDEAGMWAVPGSAMERLKRADDSALNKKGGIDYVTVS